MMKNLTFKCLFVLAIVFSAGTINAQTDAGSLLLSVNTGFGGLTSFGNVPGNTGVYIVIQEDESLVAFGGEMSYFLVDDFALKGGIGFVDVSDQFSTIVFKIGGVYTAEGRIPIGLDYVGYTDDVQASYIGIQGGYYIYLNSDLMLEPGIRYNITTDDAKASSYFQMNMGFSYIIR